MILEFKDDYRWLSNFYPSPITFRGKRYPSVEHAYQSAKSADKAWKKVCADSNEKARNIKKLSAEIELSPDWGTERVEVMRECLEAKFSQEPFRTWLQETGDAILKEGNTWGDTFWGVNLETGEGENQLGELLMDIRERNLSR